MRNLVILAVAFISLSGCYGGIQVSENFGINSSYNIDSTQIVFFKFTHVFRPAKGLLAFPDGGIPKTLYSNVSVYLFDISCQKLINIQDYGSMVGSKDRWTGITFFNGDSIIYNLRPRVGWNKEMQYPSRGMDSLAYNRTQGWFLYSLASKQPERIAIQKINKDSITYAKVTSQKLKELTSYVKYKEWGVDFNEIYPQCKFKRIAEIAQFKHSIAYRNAIIEELEGQLSDRKIDRLIKRIDKHLDSQSDYQRQRLMGLRNLTVDKLLSIKQEPN